MDGIAVHRVALYPSHDKSALRRILNYLSFSLSAFLLRFLFSAKVIIDVQDLWPESVANPKMLGNKAVLDVLNGICSWIYRRADKLTVLSPGFKQELINRGVAPEKIEVSYNWCDEASIAVDESPVGAVKPSEFSGKFIVLFAGAMGIAQGLDTVLDCARLCREALPNIQFVLIGGGVERPRLQKRTEEMGHNNVTFLPPRSMETMGEIFALADALIVHLKDDPLFRITIPSKTQAYLFTGKPIIMAMRGDAAALVEQAGAGILCEPDNPLAMLDAVRSLHDTSESERRKMGDAGHRYYMQHLSFEKGVRNFEQVMCSLIDPMGKAESDAKTS
jgi:glycosyltransferase involved in cell wall biosynthesis